MRKLLAFTLLGLALASPAVAANRPDPRLDAAASWVAGRAITVRCETDQAVWDGEAGGPAAPGYTRSGYYEGGQLVNIGPWACLRLHSALDKHGSVLLPELAQAMHTLAHEAIHARGLQDEGETDCVSLELVDEVATGWFGFSRTEIVTTTSTVFDVVKRTQPVTKTKVVTRWINKRVWVKRNVWVKRGVFRVLVTRRVRVTRRISRKFSVPYSENVTVTANVPRTVTEQREQASRELKQLVEFALEGHRRKPPAYHGTC
jgi:hypothetical protein